MKKSFHKSLLTAILLPAAMSAGAQTARVQAIHNSPDLAASEVDVYLGTTLLFDDFAFRTASPFIDAPAGVPITIGIAPSSSTSSADIIASFNYTLADGETYILVADGIVSSTGYSPAQPFDLKVYAMGREAATSSTNTDVLVHHGSTDAPVVDIAEVSAGTLVNNAAYGDFAGYLELPTNDYIIDVRDQTGTTTVASFLAPLSTLNLEGEALVVLASGFLDPSVNSSGPAFGLWVALPSGGPLVQLPATPTARVQVIHNSADAAASQVDVYLGTTLLLDNFAFRTASPFVDAPAGAPFTIGVAPATSTSSADAIATFDFTLTDGETYVVVADGIVSSTGYTPAQPFDLKVYAMGREAATSGTNTDVLVHHGSTDAPIVDIYESTAGLLVDNAAYGDFAGYLELPTANYSIEVRDQTGTTTVATYSAPLSTLGLSGDALVVVASGFLNPAVNSSGPAFGLWAALPTGGTMVQLPSITTGIQDNGANANVNVYPNPASSVIHLDAGQQAITRARLVSADGKVVLDVQPFINGTGTISTSAVENGFYTLELTGNDFRAVRKIEVRH